MRETRHAGKRKRLKISIVVLSILLAALLLVTLAVEKESGIQAETEPAGTQATQKTQPTTEPSTEPVTEPITEPADPTENWETGFVAALQQEIGCYDEAGNQVGTIVRGTHVKFETQPDGATQVLLGEEIVFLQEDASMVADPTQVIPEHTLYVRSAVNLRTAEGKLLAAFADKGQAVQVTGCDYLQEDGQVHMYQVTCGEEIGYILPWYLTGSEESALANYDDGSYATHAARENRFGGGGAANLDYYPREKGVIAGNTMPEECRSLYIAAWCVNQVDAYLSIAADSGINTFVVDIADGGSVGYAADVMKTQCPSGAAAACNNVEEYQRAIQKLKDAGYYVVGRITTFNDTYFVKDHPECAISDTTGNPMKLSGEYWPTAYNRTAWQYKVDLAVEAVELMGFHEIQFDYVRFPDLTSKYEKAGTIDFRNTYGETKAQAIQRFLMYATDILHEKGVYVSADVFGESAYNYVTAYGQYWPAISNVVDAISGMPYPDHFSPSGDWLPWEHPYETLYSWGQSAMSRQGETATPAAVRTWIQAYNAIRKPYNKYGAEEIAAQIKGLRDAGCTGGYMTWNSAASLEKYKMLMPAFVAPAET